MRKVPEKGTLGGMDRIAASPKMNVISAETPNPASPLNKPAIPSSADSDCGPIIHKIAAIQFAPVYGKAIVETELPDRIWLWEAWIPQGALVLLSALPKAGKTTFIYRLIMHMVRGRPFLGFPTRPSRVLILAVEEHRYDVYTRFRSLGLTCNDPLWVHTGHLQMNDKEMLGITTFCQEQKIDFIVVDTLSHFWPIEDENDNAEVTRYMQRILSLRDNTGATILLVHHQRKNDAGGIASGTAIRGAGALLASVDQAITLQRTPGQKNRRTLSGIGRYADTPDELVIELKDGVYTALGGSQDAADIDAFKRLALCINATPRGVDELAVATGLAERYVRKLLDKFGAGQFQVTGNGHRGNAFKWSIASPETGDSN